MISFEGNAIIRVTINHLNESWLPGGSVRRLPASFPRCCSTRSELWGYAPGNKIHGQMKYKVDLPSKGNLFPFSLSHADVCRWSAFDKWDQSALPDGKVGSEHSKKPLKYFPFSLLNIWQQFLLLQVQKRCAHWRVLLLSVGTTVLRFGSQHSESRRLLQGEHRFRTLYILYYALLFHLSLCQDILLHASKIWNCF